MADDKDPLFFHLLLLFSSLARSLSLPLSEDDEEKEENLSFLNFFLFLIRSAA